MAEKVSYSRVGTFNSCPYQYKLRYIDKLKTRFNLDPANALVLGTAVHESIELGLEIAIKHYYNNYPSLTDWHILEMFKLEKLLPKIKNILPTDAIYEKKLDYGNFIGFTDMLVEVDKNVYDLYDFKYSNNQKGYLQSNQLHIYKYFFEKEFPECKIRNLFYLFIPKINRGPFETFEKYKEKVLEKIDTLEPEIKQVKFDENQVKKFFNDTERCLSCKKFDKNITRLCDWCDYKKYCHSNGTDDTNIIYPEN